MEKSLILELIEICDKKIEHLKKIYELTKNQGLAIDEDKLDRLQIYTNRKQNEIEMINILDDTFTDKYDQYKKIKRDPLQSQDSDSNENIRILKERIERISHTLTSISEIELDNNAKIYENFAKVKAKLRQIRQGKNATKGYNIYKNKHGSAFINEKK